MVDPPICISLFLFIHPSFRPSVFHSFHSPVRLSICISLFPFTRPSLYPSVHLQFSSDSFTEVKCTRPCLRENLFSNLVGLNKAQKGSLSICQTERDYSPSRFDAQPTRVDIQFCKSRHNLCLPTCNFVCLGRPKACGFGFCNL